MELLSSVLKNGKTESGLEIIEEGRISYKWGCPDCGNTFRTDKTNFNKPLRYEQKGCDRCDWVVQRANIVKDIGAAGYGRLAIKTLNGRLSFITSEDELYQLATNHIERRGGNRKIAERIAQRNSFGLNRDVDVDRFLQLYRNVPKSITTHERNKAPTNRKELTDAILCFMQENPVESDTGLLVE